MVRRDPRRIDIEASNRQLVPIIDMARESLLPSGATPIAGVWDRKGRRSFDACGNKHRFVAGQNGLAERDNTASIVCDANAPSAGLAIRLVREWLADLAALVTVQTTILTQSVLPTCADGRARTHH